MVTETLGMTRRDFLKYLGITAGSTLLPTLPSIALADDEFTVVEKLSPQEIKSLEKILEGGSKEIPDDRAKGPIKSPEIAYYFDIKRQSSSSIQPQLFRLASAFILNNEGFFLTTQHFIDLEKIKDKKKLTSPMMLIYDPQTGAIGEGRILTYSKKHDLAFGRVAVPKDFRIETTFITNGNLATSNSVYATEFDNTRYMISGLFLEVTKAGTFYIKGDRKYGYRQERGLKKDLKKDLQVKLLQDHISDLKNDNFGFPTGITYSDSDISTTGIKPGDSGIPVFSINGDLVGIVEKKMWISYRSGHTFHLVHFKGPNPIKRMIKNYIDIVNG